MSATLAFSVAGAAVTTYLGWGPAVGAACGSCLGAPLIDDEAATDAAIEVERGDEPAELLR